MSAGHQLLQLLLECIEVHPVPLDGAGRHGQHDALGQLESRARHAHVCKATQHDTHSQEETFTAPTDNHHMARTRPDTPTINTHTRCQTHNSYITIVNYPAAHSCTPLSPLHPSPCLTVHCTEKKVNKKSAVLQVPHLPACQWAWPAWPRVPGPWVWSCTWGLSRPGGW